MAVGIRLVQSMLAKVDQPKLTEEQRRHMQRGRGAAESVEAASMTNDELIESAKSHGLEPLLNESGFMIGVKSTRVKSLHACDERCMGPIGATTSEILGNHRADGKRVCWCECHEWNKP